MPRFEDDEYADYGVRTKNRADGAAKTRRKARKPVKRGSVSEIVWDDRAAVRPTSTTRFADTAALHGSTATCTIRRTVSRR